MEAAKCKYMILMYIMLTLLSCEYHYDIILTRCTGYHSCRTFKTGGHNNRRMTSDHDDKDACAVAESNGSLPIKVCM